MSKSIAIKKFISFKEIILFAIFVIILLALFFPKKQIISFILNNPTEAPPQLIQSVIRVDPSESIKIALLEHYVKTGNYISATKYLNSVKISMNNANFLDYSSLKFKVLLNDYFSKKNSQTKKRIQIKIHQLLQEVSMINKLKPEDYTSAKGQNNLKWILTAYKFEYAMKENATALGLIKLYLMAYPEYTEQYYSEVVLLYLETGKYKNALSMLNNYIRSDRSYNKKVGLFEQVIARAIMEKNHMLTFDMLKIYHENFSNNLEIRKFILTYALKSGDPYFAKSIALKLQ